MENFTLESQDVVEFLPSRDIEKTILTDACVETLSMPKNSDKSINTISMNNVEVQTETIDGNFGAETLQSIDDEALAKWLKKIYPHVVEELNAGITNVFELPFENNLKKITPMKYQTITVKANESDEDQLQGAVAWLSIGINNIPILAISSITVHKTWCEHLSPSIYIFTPKRNTVTDKYGKTVVSFIETKTITTKACVSILKTNPFNKDMFVGATVLGDIYVWICENANTLFDVKELFCQTSEHGEIIDITWLKHNKVANEYNFLTCHVNGYIVLWKISKNLLLNEKQFKILSRTKKDEIVLIKKLININDNEFIIGTDDGKLLFCSTIQILPINNIKNCYDPIVSEINAHKFTITSLLKGNIDNKLIIISCDLSGEIIFHDINDKSQLMQIIKLPLPFKTQIISTIELDFLLSAGDNGTLDVLNSVTGEKDVIDGNLRGKGNTIAISSDGNWVATGLYEKNYQIYQIDRQ